MKIPIIILLAICLADMSVGEGLRHINCRTPVRPLVPCKKWYYSTEQNKCFHLPRDTCGMTTNAFVVDQCQSTCGKNRPNPDGPLPSICEARVLNTPCRRMFYDMEADTCVHIGGRQLDCFHGLNAWERWNGENCRLCIRGPACHAEPVPAPCGEWQAEMVAGQLVRCNRTSDGYCAHGTENNFISQADCLAACHRETPAVGCFGEMLTRWCRKHIYDPVLDVCIATPPGQCATGLNGFPSHARCQHCVKKI